MKKIALIAAALFTIAALPGCIYHPGYCGQNCSIEIVRGSPLDPCVWWNCPLLPWNWFCHWGCGYGYGCGGSPCGPYGPYMDGCCDAPFITPMAGGFDSCCPTSCGPSCGVGDCGPGGCGVPYGPGFGPGPAGVPTMAPQPMVPQAQPRPTFAPMGNPMGAPMQPMQPMPAAPADQTGMLPGLYAPTSYVMPMSYQTASPEMVPAIQHAAAIQAAPAVHAAPAAQTAPALFNPPPTAQFIRAR
jgi:hypothetical protein